MSNTKITRKTAKLKLPKTVTLIEVGPRDGFQSEKIILPTPLKVDIINGLAAAGMTTIQVTAFVSPKRVPQMADAEQLLALLPQSPGVTYNCLVLNSRGLERAIRAGAASVEISASASDTHSKKNTGMPGDKAVAEAVKMIKTAGTLGLHIRAGIQCAFGCAYEGSIDLDRVLSIAGAFLSQGPDMLVLSDTTGMATPASVEKVLGHLIPSTGAVPIALHFHDTRGLGLANAVAAMECGITHFDTALSGTGGCPFVPGATGNISTEKTADMLSEMSIETGIDVNKVVGCSMRLQAYLAAQAAH